MSAHKWTEADVPDQSGRIAIVTGSNTGLGFDTARVLAQRGAKVVIAVRDTAKGDAAAAQIRAELAQRKYNEAEAFWDDKLEAAGGGPARMNVAGQMTLVPFSVAASGHHSVPTDYVRLLDVLAQ